MVGMENKEKITKLTGKRRKLIKAIAEGKTQRQAAKEAGLNECHVSVILKEPKVKATLQQLMDKAGLSDDVLLAKHVELMSAQKTIGTVDFIEVPDYQTQCKALEMGYKLKAAFIEKREITGKDGGPIKTIHELTEGELIAIATSSSH